MKRQIIHIDEEKCNGCGICAEACHEGAIDIVDGKAKLVRENFCDGFGDCLPGCPMGAISFEEREAPAYDEAAVKASQAKKQKVSMNQIATDCDAEGHVHEASHPHATERPYVSGHPQGHGCPGSQFMKLTREDNLPEMNGQASGSQAVASNMSGSHMGGPHMGGFQIPDMGGVGSVVRPVSQLAQWPCQIKLLPTQAPFYDGAKLLIAADCTAYAYANMHEDFMKGKVTLIGCPKLDAVDYSEKLTEIISRNDIKSVTIVRMEVPCCGGLQRAAEKALRASGKFIPWQVVTISRDGKILD